MGYLETVGGQQRVRPVCYSPSLVLVLGVPVCASCLPQQKDEDNQRQLASLGSCVKWPLTRSVWHVCAWMIPYLSWLLASCTYLKMYFCNNYYYYNCWLLAKDSEVRGKPLQLGRTYHRRRTLRNTKTAGKATGNHPGKYVIRETVSMQPHHSAV